MFKRLILILLSITGIPTAYGESLNHWTVSQFAQGGQKFLVRHLSELPKNSTIEKLPWLTVIEWRYDSSGMPASSEKMDVFENELVEGLETQGLSVLAIVQTGSGVREFNLFINDRDGFMKQFNSVFSNKPVMPISINFYKEPRWESLRELIEERK